MKTTSKPQRKTLQDYEDALDRQLAKLERIDEEDQTSYKIIDFTLRTSETVKAYYDTKMRAEIFRDRTARLIDGVEQSKEITRKLKNKQIEG